MDNGTCRSSKSIAIHSSSDGLFNLGWSCLELQIKTLKDCISNAQKKALLDLSVSTESTFEGEQGRDWGTTLLGGLSVSHT